MTDPFSAGAAALSAGAKVAGELLKEDETTKQALTRLAETSPALRSAAEDRARRIAVQQAFLLRCLKPLGQRLGLGAEYFRSQLLDDLTAKTAYIPVEHLVAPPPVVAVPAIQALGYSFEEPDLKEMYLNLVASASDGRRTAPHPAFVGVIKDLAPNEAAPLQAVLKHASLGIARARARPVELDGVGTVIAQHMFSSDVVPVRYGEGAGASEARDQREIALMVGNWVRLGLIEVDYAAPFLFESQYSWMSSHPVLCSFPSNTPDSLPLPPYLVGAGVAQIEIDRGTLLRTDFGTQFAAHVMSPGALDHGTL